jgi:hypothetical protein
MRVHSIAMSDGPHNEAEKRAQHEPDESDESGDDAFLEEELCKFW